MNNKKGDEIDSELASIQLNLKQRFKAAPGVTYRNEAG